MVIAAPKVIAHAKVTDAPKVIDAPKATAHAKATDVQKVTDHAKVIDAPKAADLRPGTHLLTKLVSAIRKMTSGA